MQYWVVIDNKRKGPIDFNELKQLNIAPDSLVWREGLEGWIKAKDLSELKFIFEPDPAFVEDENEGELITDINVENETVKANKADSNYQPAPESGSRFKDSQKQKTNNINFVYIDNMQKKPKNYLALSIIATIFFSLIAIPAIIFSTLVNSRYNKGDYQKAKLFSRLALIISIIAIVWTLIQLVFFASFPTNSDLLIETIQEPEWFMPPY